MPTDAPTGDPCDKCGRKMYVYIWDKEGEIHWQDCEDCDRGWSPEKGYHDLEDVYA